MTLTPSALSAMAASEDPGLAGEVEEGLFVSSPNRMLVRAGKSCLYSDLVVAIGCSRLPSA